MKKIFLVTGGQRSGKSEFAEKLALSLSLNPVYVATARIWDDDFRERVARHKIRRGKEWENIEEDRSPGNYNFAGRVVLVDCLTLWSANFFHDNGDDEKLSLEDMKREIDRLLAQDAIFILVTNEIGLGGTSGNEIHRKFTELLGFVNQYAAEKADEVYLSIAGVQVKIK